MTAALGPGTPLLDIKGLTVDFPSPTGLLPAVRGIDLVVERGTTVGIVGESGSGKSISMLSVVSLQPPSAQIAGSVKLLGREVMGMKPRELRALRGARVGMIFQDPMTSLNPVLTIGDQLSEAFRFHDKHLSRKRARVRAVNLLGEVSISSPSTMMHSYPFELSGGMRQRVMIAIAIANNPDLIIADEPTTALDVTIQAQILELLKKLVIERNIGLIIITHDLGVVAGAVDRVAVMYGGRIVEESTVDELFRRPRHPYTAALLGCIPRPDRPSSELIPIPGAPPVLTSSESGCSFRSRCAFSRDRCAMEDPVLRSVGTGAAACLFADELDLTTKLESIPHA